MFETVRTALGAVVCLKFRHGRGSRRNAERQSGQTQERSRRVERFLIRRYPLLLLLRELSISSAVGVCFACPPLLIALFAQSVLDGRVGALAGPMPVRCRLAPTLFIL